MKKIETMPMSAEEPLEPSLVSIGSDNEVSLSPEQEAGLDYFERAKKMQAAAENLREISATMSEPYPEDINPEVRREIDRIFERITDLAVDKENPNIEQLFLEESGDIYWEKIGERLGVDVKTLRKLFDRASAELFLSSYLLGIDYEAFGALTPEDMHHIWFYDQRGEKLPDSKMSFDKWMKLNGVPNYYSGNLVVTPELWNKKIGNGQKNFGEITTGSKTARGVYIPPKDFDSNNPLEVLGVIIIKAKDDQRQTMLTALHESTHQTDFHIPDRKGDDRLITEILAFRSRIWASAADKENKFGYASLADILQNSYLKKRRNESDEEFSFRKKHIEEAVEAFYKIDSELNPAVVQHILLNCLTLNDLIAWSFKLDTEEDIEKYIKWRDERTNK